jgi:hypothetical protein
MNWGKAGVTSDKEIKNWREVIYRRWKIARAGISCEAERTPTSLLPYSVHPSNL